MKVAEVAWREPSTCITPSEDDTVFIMHAPGTLIEQDATHVIIALEGMESRFLVIPRENIVKMKVLT